MSDPESAIRERAYMLWEKEGCPPGRDQEFWERARLMVEAEHAPHLAQHEESSKAERATDEAVEETFPASDPPAFMSSTGGGKTP